MAEATEKTSLVSRGPTKWQFYMRTLGGTVAGALLAPWLTFIVISGLFMFVYAHSSRFVESAVVMLLSIYITAWIASHSLGQHPKGVIFFGCIVATVAATTTGYYNYSLNVTQYYQFFDRRQYTNVAADELAEAHRDASAIVFEPGTTPDATRPVGYLARDSMYCIAPITSSDPPTPEPDIQYFAAGLDCCQARTAFTCNDVGDKTARAGVVIGNRTEFVNALLRPELAYYEEAAKVAVAAYGLTIAKKPIFVRWVKDLENGRDTPLRDGWIFWICTSLAYFALNLGIAIMLLPSLKSQVQDEWKRTKAEAVQLEKGAIVAGRMETGV